MNISNMIPFLIMSDLKLYTDSVRELDSLIQTMRVFSNDAAIVWSEQMCDAGLEEGKDGSNKGNLIIRRKAYERG